MSIMRVQFQITGLGGLPGVHTTYWNGASSNPIAADALDVAARVRAFWDSFKANMANGVVIGCNQPVTILNSATGDLVSLLSAGAPANVTGTGTGELPKATQLLLRYNTQLVVNGRLLKGRSFIGPLSTTANSLGSVVAGTNTALLTAAALLVTGATASQQVVWHRPTDAAPTGGVVSVVTSYATNPEFSVLRSRRD
jgi:hypothetical protein